MARYTAPQIHCKADEIFAKEYVMENGDVVLAFCHATAVETWQYERTQQRETETVPEDLLFPNP